jgi:hypothetical protein
MRKILTATCIYIAISLLYAQAHSTLLLREMGATSKDTVLDISILVLRLKRYVKLTTRLLRRAMVQ